MNKDLFMTVELCLYLGLGIALNGVMVVSGFSEYQNWEINEYW
jgi:hypothetical protein